MADPRLFRLRVTFCKRGRLALLSHLEVARALERAVRRAGLPYAVSQGFSPHMKIAFGAALPVGVGGAQEIFDLQLVNYVAPERALAALQEASAHDLMPLSCAYIEPSAPAASVAFPVGTYRAVLSGAPDAFPLPREVRIVRKKKEKRLLVEEFLVGEAKLDGAELVFSLESKPTGSLRPDVLLATALEACNAGVALDGSGDVAVVLRQCTPTPDRAVECGEGRSMPPDECTPLHVVSLTRIAQTFRLDPEENGRVAAMAGIE